MTAECKAYFSRLLVFTYFFSLSLPWTDDHTTSFVVHSMFTRLLMLFMLVFFAWLSTLWLLFSKCLKRRIDFSHFRCVELSNFEIGVFRCLLPKMHYGIFVHSQCSVCMRILFLTLNVGAKITISAASVEKKISNNKRQSEPLFFQRYCRKSHQFFIHTHV